MSRRSRDSDVSTLVSFSHPEALLRKTSIEIKLFDHYEAKIYTSGSHISGEVIINPLRDTHFDAIQIMFLGITMTRLEAVQIPQKSSHAFLKLNMPIPESEYPVPRVFELGRTYTFPFHFVVPTTLTLSACRHATQAEHVTDHHLRLPPTLGSWERTDLAPTTAQVEYVVKARALRDGGHDRRPVRIFEANQLVNVLPASPEDPPLNITAGERSYTLKKAKHIRKNFFSGKLGKFTATSSQPPAVRLDVDGVHSSGTVATLQLKFVPSSPNVPPPKVSSISGKVAATTYYSAMPMTSLPNLGYRSGFAVDQRLAYKSNVPLFNTQVAQVSWKEHNDCGRRDSGYSSEPDGNSHESSDRGSSKSPIYYTASLAIPFSLPTKKKLFPPTFHSCLISRVYSVNLTLTVGPANNSIQLALPLQVAVDPVEGLGIDDDLPSFDDVLAQEHEREADEHLQPRVLRVPAPEFQGNSLLPGYEDFSARFPVRA
jgi:hypothetical protein